MATGVLPTRSCAKYTSPVRFAKCSLKNDQLLTLFERVSEKAGTGKTLGILRLNSHMLYHSWDKDIMVRVDAIGFFTKKAIKTSQFRAASFYKAARLVLTDLRVLYTRHSSV